MPVRVRVGEVEEWLMNGRFSLVALVRGVVIVCALLAMGGERANAWGSAERPAVIGDWPSDSVTEFVGVDLKDESARAAFELFEKGEIEQAVSMLDKVIHDPNAKKDEERDAVLKLCLGVIHARSGEYGKGTQLVEPIAGDEKRGALMPKAQVLLAAIQGAHKEGTKGSKELLARKDWLGAVAAVRVKRERELRDADKALGELVKDEKWGAIEAKVDEVTEIADQVGAIEHERGKTDEILESHRSKLDEFSKQTAKAIAEHNADKKSLKRDVKQDRGPNFRKQKAEDKKAVKEEERTVNEIQAAQTAIDAARGKTDPAAKKHKKNRKK